MSDAGGNCLPLIRALAERRSLSLDEYERLIVRRTEEGAALLRTLAAGERDRIYGQDVYVRGLIEISSFCRNNCLYCGLRRDNGRSRRYRLPPEEILDCTREGYELGFRTFVLQGGEDDYFTDTVLCALVREIKARCPGSAVTLSLGERGRASFQRLFDAGTDRYLLRHETADPAHYARLHPPEMSFSNRMRCLRDLKEIGYQAGCGFMVGSPFQTAAELAKDLKFIEAFKPEMCGIGPFIPQADTEFRGRPAGSAELTCYLLSIIRLIHPPVLLPATTALGTVHPMGREMGIRAGANVVMPNLSPASVRKKYAIYDGKLCTGEESAQGLARLARRMAGIGRRLSMDRGDVKREARPT